MRLPQSTKSSDRKGPTKEFGSVAQLVELRSRDPRVLIGVAHFGLTGSLRTFNPTVAGSIPVTSTK